MDPYQLAIQHIQSEENAGAVMNVDATADFDMTFDDGNDTLHYDTSDVNTDGPKKEKPFWNPHYLHALLVGIVATFFIVVFGYYIADASSPMESTEQHVDNVGLRALSTVDRVLEEMDAASRLMSVDVFGVSRNTEHTASFLEEITRALENFQVAVDTTDAEISALVRTHEAYLSSMVGGGGGVLVERALDLASLSRVRNAARFGGSPHNVIPAYDSLVQKLMTFTSRLIVNKALEDPTDRSVLQSVFAAFEGEMMKTAAMFTSYLNASSNSGAGALKSFTAKSDFEIAWKLEALPSVSESFLRYAVSAESFLSEPTTNTSASAYRSGSLGLNYITPPSTLSTVFLSEVSESYSGQGFTWNSTLGSVILSGIPQGLIAAATLNTAFEYELGDRNTPRSVVLVTVLLLLLIISVFALIGHFASVVHYVQNEDTHAAREREVRTLQKSLTRMTTFAGKVSRLDVTAVASIIRRAHRARTSALPTEEIQLYASMTTLRDKETFLPITVTRPPADIPKAALSAAGNLFVKPALVHVKSAVAVRISFSTFHNAFQTAGSKQKAVQHQLTRCLTAFQELADEHIPQGGGVLSVQGDHAILWVNIVDRVLYPTMRAVSIAHALEEECVRLGVRRPFICVAVGDALVGHVSSQPPNQSGGGSSHAHVTSFTAFGTVARDLSILDNVSRTHEADVVLNNAATMSYFQDRVEYDADSLNAPNQHVDFEIHPRETTQAASPVEEASSQQVDPKAASVRAVGARRMIPLDERFRQLHCFFRPLEMVNTSTSRVSEDTYAILEVHLTITKERALQLKNRRGSNPIMANALGRDVLMLDDGSWFKDYSRDVADGSVMFPCYSCIAMGPNPKEEEAMLLAWAKCFEAFVECCEDTTADKLSVALQAVSDFSLKYPRHGGPTAERIKRALLAARNTGAINVSAAGLKRMRLLDTVCT